jgi:GDP/UDP-N,N'-diacetylbacillosamine 2-epimerase (hydrolysing)
MKKIALITATRAEYGLLKPLIKEIESDIELELELIVTGMHLSSHFGYTYKEIEKDFKIAKKIPINLFQNTALSNLKAMSQLQSDISDVFEDISPDFVVILGDRYEMLSIATCAMMLQIPIAHIHGGEITSGAIDDSIRHAITKLSYLHFVSTNHYAKRVIQMGEEPQRVFNVGSLGVENIKNIKLLSKEEFEKSINFKLKDKNILVTYHPQTLSELSAKEQMQELLNALEQFQDVGVIFTKANADEGGIIINKMIDEYVNRYPKRCVAFDSLGELRYFSAIKYTDAVVGNSSSGILEVPSFQKPTLNIGDRQTGRIKATSVIDCKVDAQNIKDALMMVFDEEFKKSLLDVQNPYESDTTSRDIKEHIKKSLKNKNFYKKFYDIKGWSV